MRINIEIDDALMAETLKLTGLNTKREAVEEALRTLVRLRRQTEIRDFRGKLSWEDDLDAMRTDLIAKLARLEKPPAIERRDDEPLPEPTEW